MHSLPMFLPLALMVASLCVIPEPFVGLELAQSLLGGERG